MPNLQVYYNNEMDKQSSTDSNTNTYSGKVFFSNTTNTNNANNNTNTTAAATATSSPVISTANLPPGIRKGSLSTTWSEAGATGTSSPINKARHGSIQSLPNNIIPFAPSPIPEEDPLDESPPMSGTSRQGSENDLAIVGGFESEGGGEYEIFTLTQPPGASFPNGEDSDSDSDDSSSDDDDLRGLGSLFDSSTDSSSATSTADEEGPSSERRGYFTDDELDSELDEIVFADYDERTASYI